MDFSEIARMALPHSEKICTELFPLGHKRGREFVIGDIHGNLGDSLSVNLSTGIWKDFSSGNEKGGDLTSLVASAKSISQGEAAEFIQTRYGTHYSPLPQSRLQEEFEPIFPVPAPPDNAFSHSGYGEPVNIYAYYRQDKSLSNFVCRFNVRGQKTFLPLSYGKIGNAIGWHWKQLPVPRPLYGLENLPDSGKICIVEGEKAADAAVLLLPGVCILTWPGGAQGVSKVDWSPLYRKEYDILLWPDNDDPGREAMQNIANILRGKVGAMGVLDVSGLPPKSDAADWSSDTKALYEFIIANRKTVRAAVSTIAQAATVASNSKVDPLNIPGLVGDTVRWIVSCSDQPRPDMALYNTLAFAGAVFGRKYEMASRRTRTNIYIIGTGETGAGKNLSRQCLTRLATATGLSAYIGGNSIRSDTGMLRGLANSGSQILMLDEFGQLLKGINDPKQVHTKNLMRTLLTLYSDSNSIYHHGDYADPKNKPIVIHCPNLCIYGTTTESEYIPALKKSAISSGELNRFIVLPMDSKKLYPLRASPPQDMPDELVADWKKFSPAESKNIGTIVNSDTILPDPEKVGWGDCEDLQYRLRCEQEDIRCGNSPTRHLWGRLHENVTKIALIIAIGRDGDSPVIEHEDFRIAESLIRQSVLYMESLAENHMSENDYESAANDVLNHIKDCGDDGVGRSALMKRFRRMKKRDIDEIINSLLEQEAIANVMQESTGGRRKTIYKTA